MFITTTHNKPSSAAAILRALLAYGSAELASRIVRILVVIVIARQLVPELVGVAALTLSIFELVRVLANIGVGQKIIAATDQMLPTICNSAYRIFWLWCAAVAAFQFLAATIMIYQLDQQIAGQMLMVLCGVYFFMPGGLVQCFRLMRAKKLATTAKIAAAQTIADHLLTAALVLAWANPWAIVLPKLLTAPIWLMMMRRAENWRYEPAVGFADHRQILSFGFAILATDILLALRNNLDKLIISAALGVTALGTYYFAFNAGIGIVGALATAFGTVIYPHLCDHKTKRESNFDLKFIIAAGLAIFGAMTAVQYFLAPIYVPLIFGENWIHAIPLIQTLSLAGIPLILGTIASAILRARGQAAIDAWLGLAVCAAALCGLAIGAQTNLLDAASAWVAGTAIIIGIYAPIILFKTLSHKMETIT